MTTYILTSMFPNGFEAKTAELFQKSITNRTKFAFIASEFEKDHDQTDQFFKSFLDMFHAIDIHFDQEYVVDGRMTPLEAQNAVKEADVLWLSGGDTPTEFEYWKKYGLDTVIKQHNGVVIGLSAGSINMAETAICTMSCGHDKLSIYKGLGFVDFSVEPHFQKSQITEELLELSKEHLIYGLCDDSFIVCSTQVSIFYGEIYKIFHGAMELVADGFSTHTN